MIDLLRNLTKSAEEKRDERLNAYIDDALPARQRAQFEEELERDPALRADLDRSRTVRDWMGQLPRQRAPRNFTLDPARYGRPQRESLVQVYPALRVATALTAFFFILTIAMQLVTTGGGFGPAPETAVVQVEVTRVVTEAEIEATMPPEPALAAEAPVESVAEMEVEGEAMAEEVAEEEEPAAEVFAESAETADSEADEPDEDRGATADDAAPEVGVAAVPATASPTVTPGGVPTGTPAGTPAVAALVVPSATPLPTATVSELPRPTTDDAANADRLAVDVTPTATAVIEPPAAPEPDPISIPWIPAGLGGLLVVLAALTFVARRRL